MDRNLFYEEYYWKLIVCQLLFANYYWFALDDPDEWNCLSRNVNGVVAKIDTGKDEIDMQFEDIKRIVIPK